MRKPKIYVRTIGIMCYHIGARRESERKKAITFFVGNNLSMPKMALMIFKENINLCVLWFYVFFFAPPPI